MALKAIQTELVLTLLHSLFFMCQTSRKLVCSWCTIDKVILDALQRDSQHFLAARKIYIHLRFF